MSDRPQPPPTPPAPPVVPDRSADDSDTGWVEPDGDRDADILRERPPHW